MPDSKPILVTKTFLPPLKEYIKYLEAIWDKRWLTNNGQFALKLQSKMKSLLGVKHAFFVSNGTIALQLAIKALEIKGEIITTPFTFIATTTAILWENCKPVYVDIDPNNYTIDPSKIESKITKHTKAILAVHTYGYPCNVKAIEKIAKKHNLKVIYDAAHAFNVSIGSASLFNFGDISTISFHATKLFHTGEGGLIVTNNNETAKKIDRIRNFGYENDDILEVGINAKNSELHASLGLVNLKYLKRIINNRKRVYFEYIKLLKDTPLHKVQYFKDVKYNYLYFPVLFESEEQLLSIVKKLNSEKIFPRRYFYPSLNTLRFVKKYSCPISEDIASRVLCLPLYHDLSLPEVRKICDIIRKNIQLTHDLLPRVEESGYVNTILGTNT